MNSQELAQLFEDEGCNPAFYVMGQPWAVTDVYCLTKVEGVWQIYYMERGRHEPPIVRSPDESEACAFILTN